MEEWRRLYCEKEMNLLKKMSFSKKVREDIL